MNKLEAVYFDLDGTLIDTAPDFYTVLNTLLKQHGRPEVSYSAVRANVSNGARALTELGFGVGPEDAEFPRYWSNCWTPTNSTWPWTPACF